MALTIVLGMFFHVQQDNRSPAAADAGVPREHTKGGTDRERNAWGNV